jgi:serine/threonine kinase 16
MNFSLLKERVVINDRKYVVLETIGEGAYAFVYKVKCLQHDDHALYALKKMICSEQEQLVEARKEIEILTAIVNENVIPIIGSEFNQNKKGKYEVLLLLPLYHTSLQAVIDHGPGFPRCSMPHYADIVKIIIQCVRGLIAIHGAGYRHADFKPANVLLSADNHAVITDLGSACPLTVRITNRSEALTMQDTAAALTTASYRSPELFDPPSECVIDGKADVWALGCAMYALLFSRTPFETAIEGLSTLAVRSAQYAFPTVAQGALNWPPELLEVIRKCLTADLALRPSMMEVLSFMELSIPPASKVDIIAGAAPHSPPSSSKQLDTTSNHSNNPHSNNHNGNHTSNHSIDNHSNKHSSKHNNSQISSKSASATPPTSSNSISEIVAPSAAVSNISAEDCMFADFEHATFAIATTEIAVATSSNESKVGEQPATTEIPASATVNRVSFSEKVSCGDASDEFGDFAKSDPGVAAPEASSAPAQPSSTSNAMPSETAAIAFEVDWTSVVPTETGNPAVSSLPPLPAPPAATAADDFDTEWVSASPPVIDVSSHNAYASVAVGTPTSPTTPVTGHTEASAGSAFTKPTPVITSSDMIDMITLELSCNVIKEGPVYVMRPRGFLKMVVRKQVSHIFVLSDEMEVKPSIL